MQILRRLLGATTAAVLLAVASTACSGGGGPAGAGCRDGQPAFLVGEEVRDRDGDLVERLDLQDTVLEAEVSPDGERLAYLVGVGVESDTTGFERHELWVADTDGGNGRAVLAGGPGGSDSFAWAPDSSRLAVARWGGSGASLVLLDRAGDELREILAEPDRSTRYESPIWFPSGETLLLTRTDLLGNKTLWSVGVDGTAAAQIPYGSASDAALSPDGRRVALKWATDPAGGVFLVDLHERAIEMIATEVASPRRWLDTDRLLVRRDEQPGASGTALVGYSVLDTRTGDLEPLGDTVGRLRDRGSPFPCARPADTPTASPPDQDAAGDAGRTGTTTIPFRALGPGVVDLTFGIGGSYRPPPDMPECTPDQLALRSKSGPPPYLLSLTNVSDQHCAIGGYPAITVLDAEGRDLGIEIAAWPMPDHGRFRLFPGHGVTAQLHWERYCGDAEQIVLQVRLEAGTLAAPTQPTPLCRAERTEFDDPAVTRWLPSNRLLLEATDAHVRSRALIVAIPPASVRALDSGTSFHVDITNVTGATIELDPCPTYWMTAGGEPVKHTLDCGAAGPFGPGQRVTFEMIVAGRDSTIRWELLLHEQFVTWMALAPAP